MSAWGFGRVWLIRRGGGEEIVMEGVRFLMLDADEIPELFSHLHVDGGL